MFYNILLASLFLLYLSFINCAFINSPSVPYHDICGVTNGRKILIELGEKGTVSAKNITTNQHIHHFRNKGNVSTAYNHCTLELITCPYCIITVNFR